MKKKLLVLATVLFATLGAAAPAQAFPASWKNLVQFDAIGTGDKQAWIYDIACDGVPVRAVYGRSDGSEGAIANGNGCKTSSTGAVGSYRINWAILCNDYSINDDCSGRLG
ncbi:hypothetical protein [Terrabacter sp. NPDC000476]|uniref:hypothetical protein n=1 Tax=Terrabacter sp. NPDC000476 TaxID=3154258 RepID=UPI00332EBBBF